MHRFQGGSAQDVMVGNHDGIEAEQLQGLDDHDHPGHDGGRAIGVQPADLAALCLGQRGEALEDRSDMRSGHHMPVDETGLVML